MLRDMIGRCPICDGIEFIPGFNGRKALGGTLPQCAKCASAERHRVVWLMYVQLAPILKGWRALQFAPDGVIKREWFREYEYSVFGGHNSLDMTAIDRPDASYDLVISNHVIEHVSDEARAVSECLRIVGDAGIVHINAPSPGFRYETEDWGFADPKKNEHYRDYGADMGRRLVQSVPESHCVSIAGLDPVTLMPDITFFFSKAETSLATVVHPLQRAGFACTVVV